jgi:hypothetical protein
MYAYLTRAQDYAVRAYQEIRDNPTEWDQSRWRASKPCSTTKCGTQLCWGGHIVFMDGAVNIINDPESTYFQYVLARESDPYNRIHKVRAEHGEIEFGIIEIAERLRSILGVSGFAFDDLTNGGNSLSDLRKAIKTHLGVDPESGRKVEKTEKAETKCPCGNPNCTLGDF